jgi:hypothetical protein
MSLSAAFLALNPWAVLVAGLVHMIAGLIWYTPVLFGPAWAVLTGKDLKPARAWLAPGFVGHMIIALVLALIVNLANATTVLGGLLVGALVWAGFVVTLEVGELIWEKIPVKLFLIRIGEHLVALGLAGIIVAVWR